MSWQDENGGYYSEEAATFGDRLAAARSAVGLTQKTLAKKLGVKLSTVERWENDLSEPRANRLTMLCGLLNVSLPWLLMGRGDGLEEPGSSAALSPAKADMLTELRDLRAILGQTVERMARLEKQLRELPEEAGNTRS